MRRVARETDNRNHFRPTRSALYAALAAIGGMIAVAAGCETDAPAPRDDDRYMITLNQADHLDYQIGWQSVFAVASNGVVSAIYPYDDMVVATESGQNIVSTLTSRDGQPLWEEPVGDRLERLLGVVRFEGNFVINTQSDIYMLDTATGRQTLHQRFGGSAVASTAPVIRSGEAIFGTPDGRIVYHNFEAGIARAAYRFDAAIDHDLVEIGDAIAILTRGASVYLHNPYENVVIWRNSVLDPILTRPAFGTIGLYIAGADQSVWAFRLQDGRQIWRHRTERPLLDDPVVLDDIVYQAVPNEGFLALDGRTGEVQWTCPDVQGGKILTRTRDQLIVWEQLDHGRSGSRFYRLDAGTGDLLGSAHTPMIAIAAADKLNDGAIYGVGRKGRVVKLIP